MDEKLANQVYDILVNMGGAAEMLRSSFIYHHSEEAEYPCREWRFMGKLGYGGKYRAERSTVDCYMESETPERNKLR
jgi:hypothetical protein